MERCSGRPALRSGPGSNARLAGARTGVTYLLGRMTLTVRARSLSLGECEPRPPRFRTVTIGGRGEVCPRRKALGAAQMCAVMDL